MISVLVNFFRMVQNEVERRKALRELLSDASAQVDARFASLFFRRVYDDGRGNVFTVSDGDCMFCQMARTHTSSIRVA